MSDFLNQNLFAIQALISIALSLAIYFSFKFKIDFWLLNFMYSLPLVGKIARLSTDSSRYAKDKSWTNSERTLCNDYKQFVHLASEAQFNKRIDYLAKAGDTGRSPTPIWLFLVLGLLILAEGMGFSYLLGTWMAMEGSENTRLLLMGGIVFVLCIVMGFLTHNAGHQLFRTNLIRRCQKEWRDSGQDKEFRTHNMPLKNDQTEDNDEPHYSQCVNRVGTEGSYFLVGVTIAAILVIAVASTVMRVKHMESEQGKETIQATSSSGGDAGNPFAKSSDLPAAVTAPQAAADAKAQADIHRSTAVEGISAFVMLAFIFVVTQVVGMIAGYKWGFAGQNSKDAFKSTLGFSTFDDYMRYFSPILAKAEAKLSTLQQRLTERNANIGLGLKNTFENFLLDKHVSQLAHAQAAGRSVEPVEREPASVASTPSQPTVEEVVARVEQFGADKEGAKAYLLQLDGTARAAATPVLKARKEAKLRDEEARRTAALGQELDDIL